MPASAHPQPDCRGHLHHLQCGQWVRQLLVLMDGCLYIYSDIEPDAPATGEDRRTLCFFLPFKGFFYLRKVGAKGFKKSRLFPKKNIMNPSLLTVV